MFLSNAFSFIWHWSQNARAFISPRATKAARTSAQVRGAGSDGGSDGINDSSCRGNDSVNEVERCSGERDSFSLYLDAASTQSAASELYSKFQRAKHPRFLEGLVCRTPVCGSGQGGRRGAKSARCSAYGGSRERPNCSPTRQTTNRCTHSPTHLRALRALHAALARCPVAKWTRPGCARV